MTRAELELADSEDQLARRVEITQRRPPRVDAPARPEVETYLVEDRESRGGEHVSVTPPKPMDASFKGEDRANLSLD